MSDRGAHFFKCDLQVHTPRDHQWVGPGATSDEERRAYAVELVAACRERGLQAIAITDHHDMAFITFVRQAAAGEKTHDGSSIADRERLVVFPGMELTLGVPCQALVIFDAELPDDLFSLAMTALTITPTAVQESKAAAVHRLDDIHSLRQLKAELDKHTFLQGRYIVLPNVSDEGKFSLIRKGQAGKYIEMPCVGGYVDGALHKLGSGNRDILAGKASEWGNKRIAVFQTSDNRRRDHRELGGNSTWIKWATPTAEALRQACLAEESRVSQETPLLPSMAITSLSVSNSVFLGPVELAINPQYNALIGGRGTGKSTILEYLRWALCDQSPGVVDEDVPNYQLRRSRLIELTLKPLNATVDVRFEVNGVPHLVRRNSTDGGLLMKVSNDELKPCTEEDVRSLLPLQGYSQKQLSDVSVRVDELSRFVTAPIRLELVRLDRVLSEGAARIQQLYQRQQRLESLARENERQRLEERSLGEQAASLRSSLHGLSPEDQRALDAGRSFEASQRTVDLWLIRIRAVRDGALGLRATIESYLKAGDTVPDQPDREALEGMFDEYIEFLQHGSEVLDGLIARAQAIEESTRDAGDTHWHRWKDSYAAARTAYEEATRRSSQYGERLRTIQAIEERLGTAAREAATMQEELRQLTGAASDYKVAVDQWWAQLGQRDDLLSEQCSLLTANADGAIRAHVRRFADATEFVSTLRRAVSGARVGGGKIDSLGETISQAADPGAKCRAILLDLQKLAEFDHSQHGGERRPETPVLATAGFTSGELDRITKVLGPNEWLSLSLTPLRSMPVFEYRAREAEYIPFQNASAGQQATALLKTLLSQTGSPLIIDQPEEDLDNPVIVEIVEQIWRAKKKRQLLFASHNANLVVNGDAELVAWCDYRVAGDQSRGTIVGEGAIDVPKVREAIKQIMEGGEAAFNLRKEKYGF